MATTSIRPRSSGKPKRVIREDLDVSARLDELRSLKDGWLEGKGLAPRAAGLDWFAAAVARFYSADLPRPYLYPTPEGGLQAEWTIGGQDISLEVDLERKIGELHVLDLKSGATLAEELNMAHSSGWNRLAELIGGFNGKTA